MPRITISYRRDNSGVITGRIFDRLATHFGRDSVFRDIDSIPPGADFREHINHVLDESDILLAIVGPKWLGTRGGQTRLDDEADPVRVEIETGLRKKMPVIPVLVLRAAMPRASQLPDTVRDFAYRHAVQIDAGQDFDVHSARLIRAMDRILRQKSGDAPVRLHDETAEAAAIDAEVSDIAPPPAGDIAEIPPPPLIARPVERPLQAVVAVPSREPRRSGLLMGLGAGIVVGAVVATIVTVLLRPTVPPDIAALATAKEAAEARELSLQAELAGTQKKLASAQDALDAAQKKLADDDKRLSELRTSADQAAKDLAAERDMAAKAQAQAAQLAAQVQSLGDAQAKAEQAAKDEQALAAQLSDAKKQLDTLTAQLADLQKQLDAANAQLKEAQARADKAEKDQKQVAAQLSTGQDKGAATQKLLDQQAAQLADANARSDQAAKDLAAAQAQLQALSDQLATEKKAHQDALDLIAQLNGKIKLLEETAAATQSAQTPPPAAAEPSVAASSPPGDDSTWTVDQRKEAQSDLAALGHLQGQPDGNFGPATRAAIKQFQSFLGDPETGLMTDPQRAQLHDMAQRLSQILDRPAQSPQGAAAASIKGADARYARAYNFENGKGVKADPAEAAYWYALAAADGNAKAFTNLGTLLVRGQGVANPDPDGAELCWWAAAARGEATAMFNLGALWEHGVGVSIDLAKAKAWYQRAAAKGDPGAQAALKRLG